MPTWKHKPLARSTRKRSRGKRSYMKKKRSRSTRKHFRGGSSENIIDPKIDMPTMALPNNYLKKNTKNASLSSMSAIKSSFNISNYQLDVPVPADDKFVTMNLYPNNDQRANNAAPKKAKTLKNIEKEDEELINKIKNNNANKAGKAALSYIESKSPATNYDESIIDLLILRFDKYKIEETPTDDLEKFLTNIDTNFNDSLNNIENNTNINSYYGDLWGVGAGHKKFINWKMGNKQKIINVFPSRIEFFTPGKETPTSVLNITPDTKIQCSQSKKSNLFELKIIGKRKGGVFRSYNQTILTPEQNKDEIEPPYDLKRLWALLNIVIYRYKKIRTVLDIPKDTEKYWKNTGEMYTQLQNRPAPLKIKN
uniref:Uncharacterized protein n=1 Tax=Florenciella sp. virus SA2 TaxID=3240092 RepID=A0AB39JCF1_9VIRU